MKEVLCDSLTVDTCLECLVRRKNIDTMLWQSLSEPVIKKFTSDILLEHLKVLADLHSAAELKEAAVKFVVEHSEEFVDQVDIAFFYKFSPPPN